MIALQSPPKVPAFPPLQPSRADTSVDELGERIAELSAQIQAATYYLLTMIREFDERDGWDNGFRSCAHWLNWRTGLALGPAREKVRVARALGGLPLLSDAMRHGELSYSKVRALTRVASPENEQQLLEYAKDGTAAHVETLVRLFRDVERNMEAQQERLRHESRHLQAYTDEDGMVVLRARLDPEVGAVVLRAVEAAADVLYDRAREERDEQGDGVTAPQRRADALGLVAESALNGGLDKSSGESLGSRADRFQVVVHVDAEVLADPEQPGVSEIEHGKSVPAGTSRRLACDASKVVMRHDSQGKILDVGRKTRTISPALRRALNHRDKGCRFPGCEVTHCDVHHVKHWVEGGETSPENTVLLCRRHHRAVHEEGFRVEKRSRGNARFFRPDGRRIPEAPTLPRVAAKPLERFARQLAADGISMDAMTGYPTWHGGSIDWAAAIGGLIDL